MKRYFFHCPGMVYAGNAYGRNEAEARAYARKSLCVNRRPRGTAFWTG